MSVTGDAKVRHDLMAAGAWDLLAKLNLPETPTYNSDDEFYLNPSIATPEYENGGAAMAGPILLVPLAIKIASMAASRKMLAGSLAGFGALSFLGSGNNGVDLNPFDNILDWIDDNVANIPGWDTNDNRELADVIQSIQAGENAGKILIPTRRHESMQNQPFPYFTWDVSQDRGWFHDRHYSTKFVKAVRERERTAGFRGTRGRRQARTK